MKRYLFLLIMMMQITTIYPIGDRENLVVGSGAALLAGSMAGTYYGFYKCTLQDVEYLRRTIIETAKSGPLLSHNNVLGSPSKLERNTPFLKRATPFITSLISIIGFDRLLFKQNAKHDLEVTKGFLLFGAGLFTVVTSEIIRYWKYKNFGLDNWRTYDLKVLQKIETDKNDIKIRAAINTATLLGYMGALAGNFRMFFGVLEALNRLGDPHQENIFKK